MRSLILGAALAPSALGSPQGAVEVAGFAVDKGTGRASAPAVVRFLAQITSRRGIGQVKSTLPGAARPRQTSQPI